MTQPTDGWGIDLADDSLHSSALSLTEAQTLAEVRRKYSTRWVDIQEKLLSLQGKDAIRTGPARLGTQSSGASSARRRQGN